MLGLHNKSLTTRSSKKVGAAAGGDRAALRDLSNTSKGKQGSKGARKATKGEARVLQENKSKTNAKRKAAGNGGVGIPAKKSKGATKAKVTSHHGDNRTEQQQLAAARQQRVNPTTMDAVNYEMENIKVEPMEDVSMMEAYEDIDAEDAGVPHFATEYVKDIFYYLREKEIADQPRADYLLQHTETNEAMRTILVNWMVEVHMQFKTLPESMFLSVSILDRYLQNNQVSRQQLQLVGLTAMFIACKYEETIAPSVEDYVFISDDVYTEENVLDMEGVMLKEIDWNLAIPSPLHFLRRFSKAGRSDSRIHTLCKYFVELTLSEYMMLSFLPSKIAAAAVYIARKMTAKTPFWNNTLIHYTGYREEDLRPCAKSIIHILKREAVRAASNKSNVRPATRKYSSTRYFSVATVALDRVRQNMNSSQAAE